MGNVTQKIDMLLENYQDGIYVEEGALDGVKQHLGNNWGKYLGGAGALGAGALAANHFMGDDVMPEGEAGVNQQAATYAENPGARVADAALQNAQSAATQAEQDAILNPVSADVVPSRVADAALQNAQSAGTQADQNAILNPVGVAPVANQGLSFKDAWSGNNENVGGTYDRLTNTGANIKNSIGNAYEELTGGPKSPQIR